jgi:hypothetical protein
MKTRGPQYNLSHFDILTSEIKQRLIRDPSAPPFVPKDVLNVIMDLNKLEKTLTNQNTNVFHFVDQIADAHDAKNRSTENEDRLQQRRTLNRIQAAMLSFMQELIKGDPDGNRWDIPGSAVALRGDTKSGISDNSGPTFTSRPKVSSRATPGSGGGSGADSKGPGAGSRPRGGPGADSKGPGAGSRPRGGPGADSKGRPRVCSKGPGSASRPCGGPSGGATGADSESAFGVSSGGASTGSAPEVRIPSRFNIFETDDHDSALEASSGSASGSDSRALFQQPQT